MPDKSYTSAQASEQAKTWCEKRGWKRICDIPDSDALYLSWDEMPKKERNYWIRMHGEYDAEGAWREFGYRTCRVKFGFISGAGVFYKNILDVPRFHNIMMVFNV